MTTRERLKADVAEILRNDITFAPQIENYIIHGAIKNICDLFDKLVEARDAKLMELVERWQKEDDTPMRGYSRSAEKRRRELEAVLKEG